MSVIKVVSICDPSASPQEFGSSWTESTEETENQYKQNKKF